MTRGGKREGKIYFIKFYKRKKRETKKYLLLCKWHYHHLLHIERQRPAVVMTMESVKDKISGED